MQKQLRKVDFEAIRTAISPLPSVSNKTAMAFINLAEEGFASAKRMIEYATFLEGLIHDLREEKGLPQMPDDETWEAWKASLPVRCRKTINRLALRGFEDLCAMSAELLLQQKNFGLSSLHLLQKRLAEKGLTLRR